MRLLILLAILALVSTPRGVRAEPCPQGLIGNWVATPPTRSDDDRAIHFRGDRYYVRHHPDGRLDIIVVDPHRLLSFHRGTYECIENHMLLWGTRPFARDDQGLQPVEVMSMQRVEPDRLVLHQPLRNYTLTFERQAIDRDPDRARLGESTWPAGPAAATEPERQAMVWLRCSLYTYVPKSSNAPPLERDDPYANAALALVGADAVRALVRPVIEAVADDVVNGSLRREKAGVDEDRHLQDIESACVASLPGKGGKMGPEKGPAPVDR
jgi:hypothetical protein